ncbi:MAG: hypothetical protein MUP02_00230 [Actinobacteria bacterium]|nr:hypothetical protein [Actinomycetota bacterium]
MFKKILVVILIGAIIFILFIFIKYNEQVVQIVENIPIGGTYVKWRVVKEKMPCNITEAASYEYYDEDRLLERSDLIFKGIVTDAKEIYVKEYFDGRLNAEYYMDVFTFEIEKIYYSEDPTLKIGDIIKVANGSSPSDWLEGTLRMEKDKEYIVLTYKDYHTNTIIFPKYCDYVTVDRYISIIRVENGDYFVDRELESLTSDAKEEIIREDYGFETTVYV